MAPGGAKTWLRYAPLAVIAAGAAAFFAFGLHQHLSIETLRRQRAALDAFVAAHFATALAAYAGAFILGVTFSLPTTLILSVAGGYLFGVAIGAPVMTVSMTIGSTLLFVAARTPLSQMLRARAGSRLDALERGFRKNAFNYLLVLRLLPLPPVFIVNLAASIIGMKIRDFVLATLIGVIPIVTVYASVGAGMRHAFEAGGPVDPATAALRLLLSPQVLAPILGLALLALAPVALKRLRLLRGDA